jgi:membrane protein DedA with SNARE-associated domain
VSTALRWFSEYGYLAVFFPVMLELVGIPFPSETILLAAGATVAQGRLNVILVVALGTAAATIGALLGYAIGHYGGRPLLAELVRRRLLRQDHLARVDGFLARHGARVLLIVRFVPGVRIPAFWVAGSSGMPLRPFVAADAAGALVWVVLMVTLGDLFARSLSTLASVFGIDAAIVAAVVIVLAVLVVMVRMRLRDRRARASSSS